jgi:capsular exopolysaccharide synthesis family protein
MSQIFDALLRSETERGGSNPTTRAEATELLQSVERELASRWAGPESFGKNGKINEVEPRILRESQTAVAELDGLQTTTPAPSVSAEDAKDLFGRFKMLRIALPDNTRLVCLADKKSPTAEAFRLLGVRLRDLRRGRPLQRLLITSTVPQEGKSTVSANLACTLAFRTEEKVLLLEGDVRRPSQSNMLSLGEMPGLCEWLQGKSELSESIYRIEGAGLWMMPAGTAPSTPLELLQSARLPLLMSQLSTLFDWIIIDSPPILPLADTSVWARTAEGILLVTRQGTTEKDLLERGVKALDEEKLIGAILNCSQVSAYKNYYSYSTPVS